MREIILYSVGSPKCEALKKKLKAKKIEYVVNDDIREMMDIGVISVPMLRVGNEIKNYREAMRWISEYQE